MSDPNAPSLSKPSGSGATWLLGIVGVFILYLLSPGLFVVFYYFGEAPPAWVNYVLTPIAWACQEFPFVNRLYETYMRILGAPI